MRKFAIVVTVRVLAAGCERMDGGRGPGGPARLELGAVTDLDRPAE